MGDFKMFNRQFYLDKIKSEISQLEYNLQTNYSLIDDINRRCYENESDYKKANKQRQKLHETNKTILSRLKRLRADYKRYERMDI